MTLTWGVPVHLAEMVFELCCSWKLLQPNHFSFLLFLKILFIYFREGKGGRKIGRERSMCGCLSHAPYRGSGPQPLLGIKPATFWFTSLHSIHWATPVRTSFLFFLLSQSSNLHHALSPDKSLTRLILSSQHICINTECSLTFFSLQGPGKINRDPQQCIFDT